MIFSVAAVWFSQCGVLKIQRGQEQNQNIIFKIQDRIGSDTSADGRSRTVISTSHLETEFFINTVQCIILLLSSESTLSTIYIRSTKELWRWLQHVYSKWCEWVMAVLCQLTYSTDNTTSCWNQLATTTWNFNWRLKFGRGLYTCTCHCSFIKVLITIFSYINKITVTIIWLIQYV